MSAVLDSEEIVSKDVALKDVVSDEAVANNSASSGAIEIREGDWKAYLLCLDRCRDDKAAIIERFGSVVAYKRACAMAYLGRRAQLHGGVCSTRHPHIMTPQFIADLETNNRTIRYGRYPWLRALMNLLEEIEKIQDQISSTNVIMLVPSSK